MKFGKKQIWSIFAVLVFGVAVCLAGLHTGRTEDAVNMENAGATKDAADAQDPSERAADAVGNDSEPGGAKVDFEQLKAQNPDIYAWISVPGTGIDYPVLQKSDAKDPYDNYYLNHQVDLSEGFPGVIYSQPVNRRDFMDAVTVLYGHNLKNGGMFSDLHDFADKDFFAQNSQVIIYTPEKTFTYEIFAAIDFSDELLPYEYDFTKNAEVQKHLEDVRKCEGNFRAETELPEEPKILVLSTCYAGRDERRLLVEAVLTEEVLIAEVPEELPSEKVQEKGLEIAKLAE